MKVSELTGAKLDYWVGKANDIADLNIVNGRCFHGNCNKEWVKLYSPSTDWSQGGPIIEREKIMLNPIDPGVWGAGVEVERLAGESFMVYENGSTPLEAAMRCYVASKFGEEVPDIKDAPQ
jgi:hypothetical protein